MRNRDHQKIYREIQKWMDEPTPLKRKSYEVYGYLQYFRFLISRKIKIKVNPNNHQCWRHTPREVLQKFSKSFGGKYKHELVLEVCNQHLKDDLLDEDYILSKRTEIIQKEFLKLSKEHKLPILDRLFYIFSRPKGCLQDFIEFEYKKRKSKKARAPQIIRKAQKGENKNRGKRRKCY